MNEQNYGQINGRQTPKIEYAARSTYSELMGHNVFLHGFPPTWINDNVQECKRIIDNLLKQPKEL